MREGELVGMEELPLHQLRSVSVQCISNHGMTQRREVHPYLFRPPRNRRSLQQRLRAIDVRVFRSDLVGSLCLAGGGAVHGHATPVVGVAADGGIDYGLFRLSPPLNQRQEGLGYLPMSELTGQAPMGGSFFRDHDEPEG